MEHAVVAPKDSGRVPAGAAFDVYHGVLLVPSSGETIAHHAAKVPDKR